VSLAVDSTVRAVLQNGFPTRDSCEECYLVDGPRLLICWSRFRLALAGGSDYLGMDLPRGNNNLLLELSPGLKPLSSGFGFGFTP
jgi:hypothetical protein